MVFIRPAHDFQKCGFDRGLWYPIQFNTVLTVYPPSMKQPIALSKGCMLTMRHWYDNVTYCWSANTTVTHVVISPTLRQSMSSVKMLAV